MPLTDRIRFSRRWRQLRPRIITWFFVPAVLVLATVAVVTFLAYERVVQEEVVGRQRERAYTSANRLREEMAKFSDELASLARAEAIHQDYPLGQRETLMEARRRLAIFDGGVVLMDHFGRVLGTEPLRPEIIRQDWSDRQYFRELLGGADVVLSNAVHDGPDGTPVIVVAVPVTSNRGEFLGALAGMFRLGQPTLSAFYASLVRLRMGETAYLVDGNRQVIYHPQPERIGQDLATDAVPEEVLQRQVGAFRDYNHPAGDVVVAYAPVPGTPWSLITEEKWSVLTSPSRRYGEFLLVLLVLGIAMPAVGFGLLARQRRAEALERAHLEQQLEVARLIQKTLLPEKAPDLRGWRLSGHYQPAQAVGGDFYDFLSLDDGRLGLVIGDVTDKGVPAALVMATTRSLLRTLAQRVESPGEVLRQVNDLLRLEIPPKMFVTCMYAILDPVTGRLQYANAGHNLPYRTKPGNGHTAELRATSMPLGLMPGMVYEEKETTIAPGECLLFYSDGLVEAHSPRREMFGNPRLQSLLDNCSGDCPALIQHLLAELEAFTGRGWEQEDDVTLMTLQRTEPEDGGQDTVPLAPRALTGSALPRAGDWQTLARFSLPSEPGNERVAMHGVVDAVRELDLPLPRLERLKTAVSEAVMNAIEHGNHYQTELPVDVHVLATEDSVLVRVVDQGGGRPIPKPPKPNLEAKIAGLESPRGWGLFLIENMVDHVMVTQDEVHHVLEFVLFREGETDGHNAS